MAPSNVEGQIVKDPFVRAEKGINHQSYEKSG